MLPGRIATVLHRSPFDISLFTGLFRPSLLSAANRRSCGMTQLATEMAGDEYAERLLELIASSGPGPRAIALLNDIDSTALDDDGRIEVARLWQMQQSWVFAQSQAALAAVDMAAGESDREWRQDLVAAALGWSPRAAGMRLHNAATVMTDFPAAHHMLAAGELMPGHVWVLLDETVSLTVDCRELGGASRRA